MNDNHFGLAATVRLKEITSSARNRALLHRIKNNDPSLADLGIVHDHLDEFEYDDFDFIFREGDDLSWLGHFIGGNKTLKSLYLWDLGGRDGEQIKRFFIGIQRNKSIKEVYFVDGILNDGFAVMNLPHVTTITCEHQPGCENAHYFALGLRRCKSLKEYYGLTTAEIVASLSTLPKLEHIRIYSDQRLRRDECVALRELLSNTNQLKDLNLQCMGLEDEGLELLAEGFAHNSSLTDVLNLANNNIGDRGVQALALSLERNESLRHVDLSNENFGALRYNNNIGDKGVGALAESLVHNAALRVLSVSGNTSITGTGVRAISRILQSHKSGLEKLYLDRINLGDDGGKILAGALSINTSLVYLSLCSGSIGDDGLRALAAGLSRNSTLHELDFSGNAALTAAGLHSLKRYFRSPSCALKNLFIFDINLGDEGAYALAIVLRQNKSLQRLKFHARGITSKGWKAFLILLCDKSSPNRLYLSNHTLIELGEWFHDGSAPTIVGNWLGINKRSQNRNFAAKSKILHFFPDLDMVPLFQWDLKFIPLVNSWFRTISSSNVDFAAVIRNRELTAIYKFVSGLPLLVVDGFKCSVTQQRQRIRAKICELEEGFVL